MHSIFMGYVYKVEQMSPAIFQDSREARGYQVLQLINHYFGGNHPSNRGFFILGVYVYHVMCGCIYLPSFNHMCVQSLLRATDIHLQQGKVKVAGNDASRSWNAHRWPLGTSPLNCKSTKT